MNGFSLRKERVFTYIRSLPEPEQSRARTLYLILDRIEWLAIGAPLVIGMLSVLLVIPFLYFFGDLARSGPIGADLLADLGILILAAGLYFAGFFFGEFLFRSARGRKVDELRERLADPANRETLAMLQILDQDMVRNIRRHIPQVA